MKNIIEYKKFKITKVIYNGFPTNWMVMDTGVRIEEMKQSLTVRKNVRLGFPNKFLKKN